MFLVAMQPTINPPWRYENSKQLYLEQKDELYLQYAFKNSTPTSSYYNYRLAP